MKSSCRNLLVDLGELGIQICEFLATCIGPPKEFLLVYFAVL
jgi:hypothetical protein